MLKGKFIIGDIKKQIFNDGGSKKQLRKMSTRSMGLTYLSVKKTSLLDWCSRSSKQNTNSHHSTIRSARQRHRHRRIGRLKHTNSSRIHSFTVCQKRITSTQKLIIIHYALKKLMVNLGLNVYAALRNTFKLTLMNLPGEK